MEHPVTLQHIIIYFRRMSYEKYVAQEKEVKQLTEKERKKQIEKVLTFSKEKKELIARLEKKKELEFLKSLIERGLL